MSLLQNHVIYEERLYLTFSKKVMVVTKLGQLEELKHILSLDYFEL